MEFFNPVPSLQFLAAGRVASGFIYSPEINEMIEKENNLPPCGQVFHFPQFELWESIQERVIALLPADCPHLLKPTVAKFLRPMDYEFSGWFHAHEFKPEYENEVKSCLSWHSNGSIDKIETAKSIARNENFDLETRFVVSCIYFLEEEILLLYNEIRASKIPFKIKKGNAAIRFWIRMLKKGTVSSWKECASRYFDEKPIRSTDSYYRLSSFFDYLLPIFKKYYFYFFFQNMPLLQIDDFRACLLKMDNQELKEVCADFHTFVLISTFHWPFESVNLETVKHLLGLFEPGEFQNIFMVLIGNCIFKGYNHFNFTGLFVDIWNLTPDAIKVEIAKNKSLMREIQTVLNCGKYSSARSVGEALNKYLRLDPRNDPV